jgi:hypothetical protein
LAGHGGRGGHDGGRSLGAGYCAWVSQSGADNNVQKDLLTDIGRGNRGDHGSSRRLECRVYGSDYGGRGRSPGRGLVLRGRHDASNRLGRSLCDDRIDGRACGRSPGHGVAAILRRSVLHWCITSGAGGRDDVGAGGEDRQYVERELHLDVDLRCDFR